MRTAEVYVGANWHRGSRLRLRAAAFCIRAGARLAQGAGLTVTVNGKPVVEWYPTIDLSVDFRTRDS